MDKENPLKELSDKGGENETPIKRCGLAVWTGLDRA